MPAPNRSQSHNYARSINPAFGWAFLIVAWCFFYGSFHMDELWSVNRPEIHPFQRGIEEGLRMLTQITLYLLGAIGNIAGIGLVALWVAARIP